MLLFTCWLSLVVFCVMMHSGCATTLSSLLPLPLLPVAMPLSLHPVLPAPLPSAGIPGPPRGIDRRPRADGKAGVHARGADARPTRGVRAVWGRVLVPPWLRPGVGGQAGLKIEGSPWHRTR